MNQALLSAVYNVSLPWRYLDPAHPRPPLFLCSSFTTTTHLCTNWSWVQFTLGSFPYWNSYCWLKSILTTLVSGCDRSLLDSAEETQSSIQGWVMEGPAASTFSPEHSPLETWATRPRHHTERWCREGLKQHGERDTSSNSSHPIWAEVSCSLWALSKLQICQQTNWLLYVLATQLWRDLLHSNRYLEQPLQSTGSFHSPRIPLFLHNSQLWRSSSAHPNSLTHSQIHSPGWVRRKIKPQTQLQS